MGISISDFRRGRVFTRAENNAPGYKMSKFVPHDFANSKNRGFRYF
jgi:hypothetical protein